VVVVVIGIDVLGGLKWLAVPHGKSDTMGTMKKKTVHVCEQSFYKNLPMGLRFFYLFRFLSISAFLCSTCWSFFFSLHF